MGLIQSNYTPDIYDKGYIVFVFPFIYLFVCSLVRLSVCDSVPFEELLQSFMLKFLKWGISPQPLIRKHSYLDHRYPGGLGFHSMTPDPRVHALGWG